MNERKRKLLETRLEAWLRQREGALIHMKERLFLVREIENLLKEQSVNGRIFAKNMAAWRMTFDVYQMMVIDLASFFRGLAHDSKGLEQLKCFLPILRVRSKAPMLDDIKKEQLQPNETPGGALHVARLDYEHRVECFKQLFPNCAVGEKPSRDDVDTLKKRTGRRATRLKAARDKLHAHRYEEWREGFSESVSMDEVTRSFELAEDLMNSLSFVVWERHLDYPPADSSPDFDTAQDIVDIILHGSFALFYERLGCRDATGEGAYYWRLRETFYSSLVWKAERSSWPLADGFGTGKETA